MPSPSEAFSYFLNGCGDGYTSRDSYAIQKTYRLSERCCDVSRSVPTTEGGLYTACGRPIHCFNLAVARRMRHCADAILTGVDRCTLSTNGLVLDCRSALPLPENAPPIVCAIDSQLSRHLAFAKCQTIVRLGNEADNGLSSRAAGRTATVAAPAPHYAHRERMHAKATAIITLQIIDGDFCEITGLSPDTGSALRLGPVTCAVREWSPFSMIIHWVLSLGHLAVGIHTP